MNDKSLLCAVLGRIEEPVCLLDRQGRVQLANAAALHLLHYQEEALVGRRAFEAFADDNLESALERAFSSGEVSRRETGRFLDGRRSVISVSYSLDPIHEEGATFCVLLRFRKERSSQACDLALHESEAKLRTILDTISDGLIVTDEKGAIQLFNPAAERLFSYRNEEVLGRNVNLLLPSLDHEARDGDLASYLPMGGKKIAGIGREVMGRRKDGALFPFYLSLGEAWLGQRRLFVAVIHDISDRKRAAEKLLILSSAVEQSPNALMIVNAEGLVEYVNPSFTRLTGYASEEIVGRNPSLLHASNTLPEQCRRLKDAAARGGERGEEIQDRKKNGELYWALESISPIRSAEGNITHFLCIQQDITELKRERQALQESEERFRQVAEMTGEWLWEQDPEGRYIYCSGAVRQILGYEPEEVLGKSYLSLLTDEDKERWSTELPPIREIREPFHHLVNRYRHKDGHEVFTESSGEPLFNDEGRLVKWRGVDHDITTRKRYEDALRLRDRAIEAVSVGIDICDANDKQHPNIYVNPALSRITGYSREELLGRSMCMLQGAGTDKAAIEEINRALQEERCCEVVLKNYRKDGTPFWNELLISPVRDESGKLTHFIGVQSDVTERRKAEAERHELEIAKKIQLSLLPKGPLVLDGARVAGICLPATQVGGDYYDYSYSDDKLDIIIADVSGHSVGAALIMAAAHSALKAETRKKSSEPSDHTPRDILCALNELLYKDLDGWDLFISMFYLRLDLSKGLLRYSNAGHNRPLLLHEDEASCQRLDADGMILGVQKQVVFEENSLQLKKGDKILLYTDGVTEAENKEGEFFGEGRLSELFQRNRAKSPQAILDEIVGALHEFCGGQSFNDDVSMVVLEVA